ncbi:hypothetical protein TNCT_545971 [Trichonephila clavata]|uniref:Uncharacterized protein n=1 Tax=Trichonephila clavata TaxID=2740835 RepID=A0A8X6GHI2_TRICU|nr:hypothetical protein TNCT_545971 [Trichonephila clavata]
MKARRRHCWPVPPLLPQRTSLIEREISRKHNPAEMDIVQALPRILLLSNEPDVAGEMVDFRCLSTNCATYLYAPMSELHSADDDAD